jgi:hypothetical protein
MARHAHQVAKTKMVMDAHEEQQHRVNRRGRLVIWGTIALTLPSLILHLRDEEAVSMALTFQATSVNHRDWRLLSHPVTCIAHIWHHRDPVHWLTTILGLATYDANLGVLGTAMVVYGGALVGAGAHVLALLMRRDGWWGRQRELPPVPWNERLSQAWNGICPADERIQQPMQSTVYGATAAVSSLMGANSVGLFLRYRSALTSMRQHRPGSWAWNEQRLQVHLILRHIGLRLIDTVLITGAVWLPGTLRNHVHTRHHVQGLPSGFSQHLPVGHSYASSGQVGWIGHVSAYTFGVLVAWALS